MLPLEQPGYNPRILVIGGSSQNFAGPDTPASAATYLLDFSIRPLAWVEEDMSSPRVMPDGVLLPDGQFFLPTRNQTFPTTSISHYAMPNLVFGLDSTSCQVIFS